MIPSTPQMEMGLRLRHQAALSLLAFVTHLLKSLIVISTLPEIGLRKVHPIISHRQEKEEGGKGTMRIICSKSQRI